MAKRYRRARRRVFDIGFIVILDSHEDWPKARDLIETAFTKAFARLDEDYPIEMVCECEEGGELMAKDGKGE